MQNVKTYVKKRIHTYIHTNTSTYTPIRIYIYMYVYFISEAPDPPNPLTVRMHGSRVRKFRSNFARLARECRCLGAGILGIWED